MNQQPPQYRLERREWVHIATFDDPRSAMSICKRQSSYHPAVEYRIIDTDDNEIALIKHGKAITTQETTS